ncbi:MAG TPA: glycosyltransferase family 4 protein, partial [Roseiflexaceae bacterium]|nr:glycosyltransferase family 4 protein [Roseiflexaceae bacterium]
MSLHAARPLNICIITQQLGQVVSGVGLFAHHLAHRLAADGHTVCVVAPSDQRPRGELPFTFVGVPPPLLGQTQARWLTLSLNFARALAALQSEQRFDIVHFTDARESLFSRSGAATIGNIHDTYAAEAGSPLFYRRHFADWRVRWAYYQFVRAAECLAFPRLQALLANSEYTARAVAATYPIRHERLRVCYLGIDSEPYARAFQLQSHGSYHPPRILFVGGNMQRKGLPSLIAAAPRVLAVQPDAEFWVVGQDKAAARMRGLCRDAGVEANFRFWGWRSQPELRLLYAQADIFAMPSLTEAFGLVFLEAMAAGLPVVGTR